MIALVVVQTAIVLVLCVLVAGLLRSYATVLQRLHSFDGGSTAPPPFRTADGVMAPAGHPAGSADSAKSEWRLASDIDGVGLDGEVVSIRTVGTGVDTVLLFLSSGCAGCSGFWEDLASRREGPLVGAGRLLVVTKDPDAEDPDQLRTLCPHGVDLLMSSQAWTDFGVPGSPYVVVVDGSSGRVKGEGSGTSLTQISGLAHRSTGSAAAKPRSDAAREVDVDRVLLAAGIPPGHPSLYRSEAGPATVAANRSSAHFIGNPGVVEHYGTSNRASR